jgi:hypothetical protein
VSTHHELLHSDDVVKLSSDRTFGVVISLVFALLALLPVTRGRLAHWRLLVAGVAVLVIAFLLPRLLHPLNLLWGRLASVLNRIISPIVIALLFFLGFGIAGAILRILGKDLLRLKTSPDQESYWITRDPPGPAPEGMLNQF